MQQESDLRFRSNADENQRRVTSKRRKYTSKACNDCRRRRAKCDGAIPRCSRCVTRGLDCQYRAEEDRRRPAPRSYVEMLRGRIDLLERILQLNSVDIDASIAVLETRERARKFDVDEPSPLSSDDAHRQPPEEDVNVNVNTTANSSPTMCEEPSGPFGGMLSSDKALNFERDGEIRYFGPTSGRLNFGSQESTISRYGAKPPETSSQAAAADISHFRAQVNRSFWSDDDNTIPEKLKLHLIDLYFEYYQPWCQMVDEQLFRQSRLNHGRYHSPLLEYCILAVGARFSDLPELRSDPADPNTAGLLLFDKAEVLLYYDLKWPTITTIQSLSLLSILHVAVGADAAGWLRQGMAIRLALDMGLNFDAAALRGSNLLTTEEIELRRQIYWSLYCDDKLYAIYTGRVCTMLSCQASVQLPLLHPERSSSNASLAINPDIRTLLQLGLIRLSKILEKLLLTLYTPQSSMDQNERAAFFDSCMLDLKSWYYDLHPDLRIHRAVSTGPSRPSAVYILHMLYHTTNILLGKAFLTGSRASKMEPTSAGLDNQQTEQKTIIEKAESCVHVAARQICAIARIYREVFGSFRYCATTATHCTLSATLAFLQPSTAATSGERRPTSAIRSDIDLCLEVLAELSVPWSTAGKLLTGLKQLVNSHLKKGKSKSTETDSNANRPPGIGDDTTLVAPIHEAQSLELEGQLHGSDLLTLDNWDVGQTDSWLFGQEVDLFGSLPSDYQAFDSLSFLKFSETWNT